MSVSIAGELSATTTDNKIAIKENAQSGLFEPRKKVQEQRCLSIRPGRPCLFQLPGNLPNVSSNNNKISIHGGCPVRAGAA